MNRLAALIVSALTLLLLASASHANVITYEASLSGAAESPPNASPGTGFAKVIYDDLAHTLAVDVAFSGLLSTTTASHIHAPTASPDTGTAGIATTVMGLRAVVPSPESSQSCAVYAPVGVLPLA